MKSDVLEIYADGAGVMLDPTISKLNFYSIVDSSDNNPENQLQEETKVQIAIPTITFLKLCASFLTQVKNNKQGILKTIDHHKEEMIDILENIDLDYSDEE